MESGLRAAPGANSLGPRLGGSHRAEYATVGFLACAVKGVDLQWVQFPPGNWSLQPVAIGAAVEVTKLPKPSMERVALATPRAGRP